MQFLRSRPYYLSYSETKTAIPSGSRGLGENTDAGLLCAFRSDKAESDNVLCLNFHGDYGFELYKKRAQLALRSDPANAVGPK